MARGDPVPNEEHIARYCGGSYIEESGRPNGTAFRLKEKEGRAEEHLSVDWLEILSVERSKAVAALRAIFRRKMKKVGATSKFAILNVEHMIEFVRKGTFESGARNLTVIHIPEENDIAHSGVFGFQIQDILIADLIADAVAEVENAVES